MSTKLVVNEFGKSIGLVANAQGRFMYGPEHVALAYTYAANFANDGIVDLDGVTSPAITGALIHGIHPAKATMLGVEVLEPLPYGKGSQNLIWTITEADEYTLVHFEIPGGNFDKATLNQVIPPEVNPAKPVIVSGRGPGYLSQTIAAAYRHFRGVPAVAYYQPASGTTPANTTIGISHDDQCPMGMSFGEPVEIGVAKQKAAAEAALYAKGVFKEDLQRVLYPDAFSDEEVETARQHIISTVNLS
jgi:hypothetical protein